MIKLVSTLLYTYTELFSVKYNTTNETESFHAPQEKYDSWLWELPITKLQQSKLSNKYPWTRDTPNSEQQIPDWKGYKLAYLISLAM